MSSQTQKYYSTDKAAILKSLRSWILKQEYRTFFTTCYKARAIGVFIQYEETADPYLYATDQGPEDVLYFVGDWLKAIVSREEVIFRIEERERVGFSVFLTLMKQSDLQNLQEVKEIEVTEEDEKEEKDIVLVENEKRSLDEIAVSAITAPISRLMSNDLTKEGVLSGIQRLKMSTPKVERQRELKVEEPKKKEEKKTKYDWSKLPALRKKYNNNVAKIAEEIDCSEAAVRRRISIDKND